MIKEWIMRKMYYIAAMFAVGLMMSGCGDGLNLPDLPAGTQTDLFEIPLEDDEMHVPLKPETEPMIHCGALHTPEDFERVKANLDRSPWKEGYERLCANSHAQTDYVPNPQASITRGSGTAENYRYAYNDVAAAYQLALRWKISGDNAFADKAVEILNGWAAKCTVINGTTDSYLAAGIYGYQFAVAGELMRGYEGWAATSFKAYQDWMVNVFYPMNSDFLKRHNDTPAGHYWANWGLCNIASMVGIGILADRRDLYNEAIEHFQIGETNGCIMKAIYHVFEGADSNLAQWQESNRDQGHTYMCQGLMGVICQLCWNQGDDFFTYNGENRFLKGCEYTAKYNYAGLDVPNVPYTREYKGPHGTAYEEHPTISARAIIHRPIWALPYYHYKYVKAVDDEAIQYTEMAMKAEAPEGGGGDYGSNSGEYDNLGFGTLMYARD